MHVYILIFMIVAGFSIDATSQENLELYRGGNAYSDENYSEAKLHYENVLNLNPKSYRGAYNLGNASYKEENFEEAKSRYQQAVESSTSEKEKAAAMHNLGNTYLKAGKLEESIKTYKSALRLDPTADDTRYNLAFAQKMLKQQENQEEKQQEDQDQNEENKEEEKDEQEEENQENQEKQDKEEGDGDEENQDKGEQNEDEKGDNENKENQPKEGDESEGEKPEQEAKPLSLTPREAEQMLDAAKNEDAQIQMKLIEKRKQSNPKKIDKDW